LIGMAGLVIRMNDSVPMLATGSKSRSSMTGRLGRSASLIV